MFICRPNKVVCVFTRYLTFSVGTGGDDDGPADNRGDGEGRPGAGEGGPQQPPVQPAPLPSMWPPVVRPFFFYCGARKALYAQCHGETHLT
jgi:hypothetical protein